MLYQIDQASRMSHAWVRDRQIRQAAILLNFANKSVPLYRGRLPGIHPGQPIADDRWLRLPVLTRAMLQKASRPELGGNEQNVLANPLPKGHEQISPLKTSGSTGLPVTAFGTQLTRFLWQVWTVYEHLLHQRDFSLKLAALRPEGEQAPGVSERSENWGSSTAMLMKTGPGVVMNVRTPVIDQKRWLEQEQPGYLLSFPSNLEALMHAGLKLPRLKGIRTYGELLTPALRQTFRDAWQVPVTDVYSSQEVGYMALQCPHHDGYHVTSESVLMEVLRDDGQPCQPGEMGRVVVTTLQNFATPLIRYEIGDYAEVAEPCPCGRPGLTLKRIVGRVRNMLSTPDGNQIWPSFILRAWTHGLPISQFQFVQTHLDRIEVRLVVSRQPSAEEEQRITRSLQDLFGWPFTISFNYMDSIPRSQGGKYEEFMSMVNQATTADHQTTAATPA
jgi:phenylacetate-CoA ligase